jgi:TonB family protein
MRRKHGGRNHSGTNHDCAKHRWMKRFAGWGFGLVLAGALFAVYAAADTRKPVANPDPEYPEIARRMNISGTVKVELVIASDGTIKSAKVLGGHPLLADAVQKALKKWKYAPGASETTLQVDFKF